MKNFLDGSGVYSASNRNKYQKAFLWSRERPARKADNLTAIYEPIVQIMGDSRYLTIMYASTACYEDIIAWEQYVRINFICYVFVFVP
jgi:hypothetical protein